MASFASRLTSCFILVVSGFVFHSLAPPRARGDIREGFESAENCWKLVQSDGRAEIRRQTRDLRSAHSGQASESLPVFTQGGSYAYLAYEIPPARLIDELAASIWLRCDRPGIQFAARIVLPHVQDDRTGRPVDSSLGEHADAIEEMKADLASLFTLHQQARAGTITPETLRAVQAEREKAQSTLAYLIGMERQASAIRAADGWPDVPAQVPADLVDTVVDARADVAAATARVRAAEKVRDLARALRTRDITAGVQYEHFQIGRAHV